MEERSRAETARLAIRTFQITVDALLIRGYYRLGDRLGETLEDALRTLSPEIYGTMNDPKSIELRGLEYILDRLPKGIEECSRIVMTAQEDLAGTSFEMIRPPKRRRISYRINEHEMSFIITRGLSEIYDILTHITFLYIEAKKVHAKIRDEDGHVTEEWKRLEETLKVDKLIGKKLEQAIWNLSLLLGRTYYETKEAYNYFEKAMTECNASKGLFYIIYNLGKIIEEETAGNNAMTVLFSPSLTHMILHQIYGKKWAAAIKEKLYELGLHQRPLHIVSANLHSIVNLLYAYAAHKPKNQKSSEKDFYRFIENICEKGGQTKEYAKKHGFYEVSDKSGAQTDWQIIDTSKIVSLGFHPGFSIDSKYLQNEKPVIFVMDYAFGTQAFELMDELLQPWTTDNTEFKLMVQSISVMGKAGILPGKRGDIMLATSHVLEGTPHNYMVDNGLDKTDFNDDIDTYVGPIITVLGTSLQNRDLLEKFHTSSWAAVGLEMEGGHYQRAINAAIIRRHISKDIKVRYAYYASDNPMDSGQTLASGSLGSEGIRPTYMVTKAIVQKILNG